MRKQQEAQTAKECAKSVALYSLLIKLASPIYAREGKSEGKARYSEVTEALASVAC